MAGPWVAELSRVWLDTAPQLSSRKLLIDLRNVTYADSAGTDALKEICMQGNAKLLTSSPLTEYLARKISNPLSYGAHEEVENANRA